MQRIQFPFTAISGQDDFKLCLILCMIDSSIGGVLAFGDKGTGKTTAVRALEQLMKINSPNFSFVNLPLGATEDRVLGSIELETLINEKRTEIRKGLLSKANHGILYIDEVNLLNDYLMDVLLDASSSGGYFLERDGLSQWQESKFCLVGTMNQEEGSLRPQLLDRFGLGIIIKTTTDHEIRQEIMRKRLGFDADPQSFYEKYAEGENLLCNKIFQAKSTLEKVIIPENIFAEISHVCIDQEVEGHRADILLIKASRAFAALNNDPVVTTEHLLTIQPLVLGHRARKKNGPTNSPKRNEGKPSGEEKEGDTEIRRMK